jgi:hypothetical protein
MHETTVSQFNIAENVAELYKEKQVKHTLRKLRGAILLF